jgi:alkaline phosphatase D
MGDADVFLLDNRTHRVNHKLGAKRRQMLGDVQLNWLINNLKNSRAPFKLVAIGGQMVSDAAIYENFAQFPEERERLFAELNRLKIRGVVFLTGDRHNSELSKIQLENGNWVYDLTVSPLTSGSYDHSEEPNNLRVAGTMVGDRNYGILEITGPRKERSLRMTVKAADGTDIWSRSIAAAEGYEIAL